MSGKKKIAKNEILLENMIEVLIDNDIKEIVEDVRSGRIQSPGDIRHLFYEGNLGYVNWSIQDIKKRYNNLK